MPRWWVSLRLSLVQLVFTLDSLWTRSFILIPRADYRDNARLFNKCVSPPARWKLLIQSNAQYSLDWNKKPVSNLLSKAICWRPQINRNLLQRGAVLSPLRLMSRVVKTMIKRFYRVLLSSSVCNIQFGIHQSYNTNSSSEERNAV